MTDLVRPRVRPVARVATTLLWALAVAVASIALASLGTGALYAVGGVVAVVVIAYGVRDELRGPVTAGLRRIVPKERVSGRVALSVPGATDGEYGGKALETHRSPPRVRAGVVVALTGAGSASLAWAVAQQGTKAVMVLLAIIVLGLLLALLWPLVVDLITQPQGEPIRRTRAAVRDACAGGGGGRVPSRLGEVLGVLIVGAAGAGVAWTAATAGKTGLIVVAAVIVLMGVFTVVRDRTVFFTFAAVCSLTVVLHKSFGPQNLHMSGGAIAIYVTTFDLMVVLLYGLWIREGTFLTDVRAAMREPVIWFPLVGAGLLLPSLLVAPSLLLAMAELFRMTWMYLLYVYVAVRVQTRRHIWVILSALVIFAAVELFVVVLQWRTGGVLGLSFLGVPTVLGSRVTDAGTLGRPFGTIIHPVFMAAALGVVGMVALAFAIELKRSLTKLTATAVVLACVSCMWISDARASVVAAVMAGVVVVGAGIARRHLAWSALRRFVLGLLALGLLFYSLLSQKFVDSFQTGHFLTEVQSRLELNDIAGRMISDHLVVGVGLNNFQVVLPSYETSPVIFFGNPVHNLYLLVFAETGLIGLLGVLLVGVGLYDVAIRLARSRDPLFGTLGIGIAAAMGFLMLEELLGFSLRQDIPLALYWLLAGLAVAAARMSKMPWPALRSGAAGTERGKPFTAGIPRTRAHPSLWQHAIAVPASAGPWMWTMRRSLLRFNVVGVGRAGAGLGRFGTAWNLRARTHLLRGRRMVAVVSVAGLLANPWMSPGLSNALATSVTLGQTVSPILVFSAVERATGVQGIYTADASGAGVSRITPADGRFYSWPRWAFGNTRIVYTVRSGAPGSPEAIAIMKPDGSSPQILQQFDFRVGQPAIDPSGHWLVFTATTPWFPKVAIFRMDLATGESTNLTARTVAFGGFDSDPSLSPGADRLAFVWTLGANGAAIAEMNPDVITRDAWFNTDPAVSPDGSQIAIASYRGGGSPGAGAGAGVDVATVKPGDWHVVLRSTSGGSEKALTAGVNCTARPPDHPCSPAEMSGFEPRFTPDGRSVSFTGALDSQRTCICAVGVDGSNPQVIIASSDLAIDWYDWPQAHGAQTSTARIGSRARDSKLLIVTARPDGKRYLMGASPDLMHRIEIPLPAGLRPLDARWGPHRGTIVFTAQVAASSAAGAPHPAAPNGQVRRTHVTLDNLNVASASLLHRRVASQPASFASRQVFLRSSDGSIRQITDPWTEDWRDGLGPGDARANTSPVMTPDGRYVIVTNTSTTTGESFLLRIDLRTGAVLNLTNGSAGALPTDDSEASVSPDGSRIAFSWTQGQLRGVYVMDTETGTRVSAMASGDLPTSMPAWAPDGRALAFVTESPGGAAVVWAPLSATLTTGPETVLSADKVSAGRPVVAPEGDRLVFLATAGNVLGLYAAPMRGAAVPQLVQADPLHNIFDVDWR
jgi:Tol biopolymer transport system component/O-antigen ligase